jgi:hypothetical protein
MADANKPLELILACFAMNEQLQLQCRRWSHLPLKLMPGKTGRIKNPLGVGA